MQHRILEPEFLDSATDQDAALNLRDIARINLWTGARSKLLSLLSRRFSPSSSFRFLDVGAASGDMAAAIKQQFPNSQTICLDLQHRNLSLAPKPSVQADAFHLPFSDHSFDVVHCSLFLHHFTSEQALDLIREMHRVSNHLVLIQDLHRHWLSYYFLPLTRWCFGWQPITVSDGMKSVQAGWTRSELEDLLQRLNLQSSSRLQWHFPSFRYFIAITSRG